jgi:heptaprenylglyceryl phosphate synthase
MFRPKWPSSGVEVAVLKKSAAHCNAVLFPYVVASDSRLYVWVNQLFHLDVLEQLQCTILPYGFVVFSLVRCVADLNVFIGVEVFYMAVGHHRRS